MILRRVSGVLAGVILMTSAGIATLPVEAAHAAPCGGGRIAEVDGGSAGGTTVKGTYWNCSKQDVMVKIIGSQAPDSKWAIAPAGGKKTIQYNYHVSWSPGYHWRVGQ